MMVLLVKHVHLQKEGGAGIISYAVYSNSCWKSYRPLLSI